MERRLSNDEIGGIQRALDDARNGRATLKQLAHAHDLCETYSDTHVLSSTIGELRGHIRDLTPAPPEKSITIGIKSLGLSIIAGIITWVILGRRSDAR